MHSNYITGQREPGETSAAEWGERPRETVTVMPVYPAKSGTQGAAPGALPVPGPKLLCERFTRLLFDGRVIFVEAVLPHAFYRKHDSHFKPPGRGRTADLSRPAFQGKTDSHTSVRTGSE